MSLNYQVKVSVLASTKVKSCFDAYPYPTLAQDLTFALCSDERKFKKFNSHTEEALRIECCCFHLVHHKSYPFLGDRDLAAQCEFN